ncbi:hypothetical protein BN439_1299 [Erwinia amylovora Ea644]|nr:hypothetical protein BN439_1299 [Erwinia amylovora Ea644]CCP06406.1 hypothetical protein BN440_1362 [Erwinia amylovora MR1]
MGYWPCSSFESPATVKTAIRHAPEELKRTAGAILDLKL